MDKLKQLMLECEEMLIRAADILATKTILSSQHISRLEISLAQLEQEQKRCIEDVTKLVGCIPEECDSVSHMEELLEKHAQLCQKKAQQEEVLRLVLRFTSIVGEEDYGFALEPFQKALRTKTIDELLEMNLNGDLDAYRTVVEFTGQRGLTIDQVMPLMPKFNPHVIVGLMASKYVCMLEDTPKEAPEIAHAESSAPEDCEETECAENIALEEIQSEDCATDENSAADEVEEVSISQQENHKN